MLAGYFLVYVGRWKNFESWAVENLTPKKCGETFACEIAQNWKLNCCHEQCQAIHLFVFDVRESTISSLTHYPTVRKIPITNFKRMHAYLCMLWIASSCVWFAIISISTRALRQFIHKSSELACIHLHPSLSHHCCNLNCWPISQRDSWRIYDTRGF